MSRIRVKMEFNQNVASVEGLRGQTKQGSLPHSNEPCDFHPPFSTRAIKRDFVERDKIFAVENFTESPTKRSKIGIGGDKYDKLIFSCGNQKSPASETQQRSYPLSSMKPNSGLNTTAGRGLTGKGAPLIPIKLERIDNGYIAYHESLFSKEQPSRCDHQTKQGRDTSFTVFEPSALYTCSNENLEERNAVVSERDSSMEFPDIPIKQENIDIDDTAYEEMLSAFEQQISEHENQSMPQYESSPHLWNDLNLVSKGLVTHENTAKPVSMNDCSNVRIKQEKNDDGYDYIENLYRRAPSYHYESDKRKQRVSDSTRSSEANVLNTTIEAVVHDKAEFADISKIRIKEEKVSDDERSDITTNADPPENIEEKSDDHTERGILKTKSASNSRVLRPKTTTYENPDGKAVALAVVENSRNDFLKQDQNLVVSDNLEIPPSGREKSNPECSSQKTQEQVENHGKTKTKTSEKNKKEKQLVCRVCEMQFSHAEDFKSHIQIHPDKRYVCPKCSAAFTRMKQLIKHGRNVHEENSPMPFVCDVCSRQFTTRGSWKSHLRKHQEKDSKDFLCHKCDEKFDKKTDLENHQPECIGASQTNEPRSLNTNVTENRITASKVVASMDKINTISIKTEADVARTSDTDNANLLKKIEQTPDSSKKNGIQKSKGSSEQNQAQIGNHEKTKTKTATKINKGNTLECRACGSQRNYDDFKKLITSYPEKYSCPKCIMVFPSLRQLAKHRRYLHEEKFQKLYVCDRCDVQVTRKHSMKLHTRKHRKQDFKNYLCHKCERRPKKKTGVESHQPERIGESNSCGPRPKNIIHENTDGKFVEPAPVEDSWNDSIKQEQNAVVSDNFRIPFSGKGMSTPECAPQPSKLHSLNAIVTENTVPASKIVASMDKINTTLIKTEADVARASDTENANLRKEVEQTPVISKQNGMQKSKGSSQQTQEQIENHGKTKTKTSEKNKKEKQLVCRVCEMQFSRAEDFKSHIQIHPDKRYVCPKCSAAFTRMKQLIKHGRNVHEENSPMPFVCDVCSKPFTNEHRLKTHKLKRHENDSKDYVCRRCDEKFKAKTELKSHRPDCIGKPQHGTRHSYTCEQCKKDFCVKEMWESHVQMHLKKNDDKICGRRNETFLQKDNKESRQFEPTTDKGNPNCDTYEKQISENSKKAITVEKPVNPNKNQILQEKSLVSKELVKPNKDYKKYICGQCDKRFHRRENLNMHLKSHSSKSRSGKTDTMISQEKRSRIPGETHSDDKYKIHHCGQCEKRFSKREQLLFHLQTHAYTNIFNKTNKPCLPEKKEQTNEELNRSKEHENSRNKNKPLSHKETEESSKSELTVVDKSGLISDKNEKPISEDSAKATVEEKPISVVNQNANQLLQEKRLQDQKLVQTKDYGKKHICGRCDERFYRWRTLQFHLKTNCPKIRSKENDTTISEKKIQEEVQTDEEYAIYLCGQCDERFSVRSHLQRHLQIHGFLSSRKKTEEHFSPEKEQQSTNEESKHLQEQEKSDYHNEQSIYKEYKLSQEKTSDQKEPFSEKEGEESPKQTTNDGNKSEEQILEDSTKAAIKEKPNFFVNKNGNEHLREISSHSEILDHTINDVEKYICDHCDGRFFERKDLKIHQVKYCTKITSKKELFQTENDFKKFVCDECNGRFFERKDLALHLEKFCTKISSKKELENGCKKYVCGECNGRFSERKDLALHLEKFCAKSSSKKELENGCKKYVCGECNGGFSERKDLALHLEKYCAKITSKKELVENDCEKYVCGACNGGFSERDDLALHVEKFCAKLTSKKCPTTVFREKCLQISEESQSDGELESYLCGQCDQRFLKGIHLRRHLQTHVTTKTSKTPDKHFSPEKFPKLAKQPQTEYECEYYLCGQCDERFTQRELLKLHLRKHASKSNCYQPKSPVKQNQPHQTHICGQCDKRFYSTFALRLHVNRHSKDSENLVLNRSSNQASHESQEQRVESLKRTHTDSQYNENVKKQKLDLDTRTVAVPTVNQDNERLPINKCEKFQTHTSIKLKTDPNICGICDTRFLNKNSFTAHRRSHHVQIEYICHDCSIGYSQEEKARRHSEYHNQLGRPYFCYVCHRGYSWKGGLKHHLIKHGVTKTFVCGECDKQFYKEEALVLHLQLHFQNSV